MTTSFLSAASSSDAMGTLASIIDCGTETHDSRRRYRLGAVDLVRLTDRWGVALCGQSGQVTELDTPALAVLESCGPERTLSEHVDAIKLARPDVADDAIRQLLESAVAAGLLCEVDARPRPANGLAVRDEIGALAIVTADRPAAFRRCLASYIEHAREHGHKIPVVVADGSRDSSNREAVLTIVEDTRRHYGVEVSIIGRPEVHASWCAMAKAGLPLEVVRWLLPTDVKGYAAGGTRNRVLLACGAVRVLTVDDDTVCTVWSPPERENSIELVGHDDPRHTTFFEDRAEALASVRACGTDLFDALGRFLGRTLAELARAQHVNADRACTHLRHAVDGSRGRTGVIRTASAGLAGDAAIYCPYRFLHLTGRQREFLAQDESLFNRALRFREVRRSTLCPTVIDEPDFMAYCAALDATALLPPFAPASFNEDGLFGVTLRACDHAAFIAQIPIGIFHDSHRPSQRDTTEIPSASCMRMTDVLNAGTRQWSSAAHEQEAGDRMRALGRHFVTWSRLDEADFRYELVRVAVTSRAIFLRQCESLLSSGFPYPRYWIDALERYHTSLRASLQQPEFFVPKEFRCDGEAALRQTQEYMKLWGEGLMVWPDMWQHACHAGDTLFRSRPRMPQAPANS